MLYGLGFLSFWLSNLSYSFSHGSIKGSPDRPDSNYFVNYRLNQNKLHLDFQQVNLNYLGITKVNLDGLSQGFPDEYFKKWIQIQTMSRFKNSKVLNCPISRKLFYQGFTDRPNDQVRKVKYGRSVRTKRRNRNFKFGMDHNWKW